MLEKYQASKSLTNCYGSVVCAGELTAPAVIKQQDDLAATYLPWLYPAIIRVIEEYPTLCLVPTDYDQSSAHFKVAAPFSLADLISVRPWSEQSTLEAILRDACDQNLLDTKAQLPPWRLQVFHGKKNAQHSIDTNTGVVIVLITSHVIMDGKSLTHFWSSLLRHLPASPMAADTIPSNWIVKPAQDKALAAYKCMEAFDIPRPTARDYASLFGGIIKRSILPNSLLQRGPPLWQGDAAAIPDDPHHTAAGVRKVDGEAWAKVISLAKTKKISVHAVVYMAFIVAWAKVYPGFSVSVATPVNCRPICKIDQALGNYVGESFRVWHAKKDLSDTNRSFWPLAQQYYTHLQSYKAKSCIKGQFLGLLAYPKEYIGYWNDMRKNKMKRAGGMEHSDLGRFGPVASEWTLHDLWFMQSAQTFTNVLGLQTITCVNALHASFCWQKGSMDDEKVQQVLDGFTDILVNLEA
ncbi:hypothetical protein DM01DRAFT_1337732 [Hesseltinella vesiculosa]|uniref:CoA-dependent acyltransferase n=1 Tax=Hesseltinella vesiculosa TaxID=101127 RepID=A0A1X2GCL3_9FUNG|nr:hypothetical protein DM01DRAFT_1337732 [Hesseltinella vesiculosa]